MSELRFSGTVGQDGRIHFDSNVTMMSELRKLAAGMRVSVLVRVERPRRSTEQNRLLWHTYGEAVADGVDLVELSTGAPVFQTRQQVHDCAKMWFLRRPVVTNRGELDLLGTTTTLTTSEFSEFLERVVAKLAQFGVYVPPPGGGR